MRSNKDTSPRKTQPSLRATNLLVSTLAALEERLSKAETKVAYHIVMFEDVETYITQVCEEVQTLEESVGSLKVDVQGVALE
ncbi:unnamed protein product [Linum trigynum]|uniref:Uncharacterized protein n=1 Tax=Linum trigynum TaxID=586398 RepID=A0AAV2GA32_9ROSI